MECAWFPTGVSNRPLDQQTLLLLLLMMMMMVVVVIVVVVMVVMLATDEQTNDPAVTGSYLAAEPTRQVPACPALPCALLGEKHRQVNGVEQVYLFRSIYRAHGS